MSVMSNTQATVYNTAEEAEDALDALDSSVCARIEPYSENGAMKFIVISETHSSISLGTLESPGNTNWVSTGKNTLHTISITVSSIDTSVDVRVEGSIDGINGFNLSALNADTTITSNGTYGFTFFGALTHVRVVFVSEEGGNAANIVSKYLGVV